MRKLLFLIFISFGYDLCAETRVEIKRVGMGDTSTSFGYFGTTPESPDGKWICYLRYVEEPSHVKDGRPAELWVCRRDLSGHRKLCQVSRARPHNGVEAQWLDQEHVAYALPWGGTWRSIHVIRAVDGTEAVPALQGITDFSHNALNGKIFFASDSRGDTNRFAVDGLYEWDVTVRRSTSSVKPPTPA